MLLNKKSRHLEYKYSKATARPCRKIHKVDNAATRRYREKVNRPQTHRKHLDELPIDTGEHKTINKQGQIELYVQLMRTGQSRKNTQGQEVQPNMTHNLTTFK